MCGLNVDVLRASFTAWRQSDWQTTSELGWPVLQELQGDLRQMMHLRHQAAEYQLAIYPSNGSQYVRHRDAFPDDGSEDHQRRVRLLQSKSTM